MDRHEPVETVQQTLADAAEGDEQAWAALVKLYSRRVYGLVLRQCGDRELAGEITQDTFVQVVVKLGKYTEQGRFEPWLFRIAMNKLRDEMRRRKRQARPVDLSDAGSGWSTEVVQGRAGGLGLAAGGRPGQERRPDQTDPLEQVSHADQIRHLRETIAAMGKADQEILHLRYTAELSFAQIAETLDQPLGTVLARGHRALGKLKKLMGDHQSPQLPKGGRGKVED